MNSDNSGWGWRVFGLGVLIMGAVSMAIGNFDPGQPVPKAFPDRAVLAYLADGFMIVTGAALLWRRTAAWGAVALALYYSVVVLLVMNGYLLLRHYAEYGMYENLAEEVAITAAAVIIYAAHANIDTTLARRLTRGAQLAFGICAVIFGGAHFVYMNMTAPLVPKWLPPNQLFWGYATGVAHIAAGLAIISGVRARLAAILLTIMYASFTPLVHLRMLFADPHNHFLWTENAVNVALTGVAWVVADSLSRARR